MSEFTFEVASIVQTQEAAEKLAALFEPDDVVLLSGDLGAGKTAFCGGIGRGLGIKHAVQSPTFNLHFEYDGRLEFHHFDLYRLDDAEQLIDIDYFGILESGGVSAVEWAEKFPEACPDECLHITISYGADAPDSRLLSVEAFGARYEQLLEQWKAALQ